VIERWCPRALARAKVCGANWAHLALADGRLYMRDDKESLYLQLSHLDDDHGTQLVMIGSAGHVPQAEGMRPLVPPALAFSPERGSMSASDICGTGGRAC
jgi:hypothetical protein